MFLLAGSILVWVAILVLYVEAGMNSFNILELEEAGVDATVARVLFPVFYVGFGILAGMWPFHTWSPDGHVAAPTAVSMLHAGVLMKLGAYGIIRVGMQLAPEGASHWLGIFLVLAVVNVIYGALSAMAQRDLKYVIGYSSVSHMGYVLMGIGSMTVVGMNGAVLQMFSHGIMTALFFAMVGVLYDRSHTREISAFSGMAKVMPKFSVLFIIGGLASLGLPGLSGFAAEFLVFVGTFNTAPWLAVLGIIGVAITATYILRLIARMFFGPVSPQWKDLSDANRLETTAGVFLVGLLVLFGIYPQLMVGMIDVSAISLMSHVGG
jgi:NADH-quinone oxidoreductase subunit M